MARSSPADGMCGESAVEVMPPRYAVDAAELVTERGEAVGRRSLASDGPPLVYPLVPGVSTAAVEE